MNILFYAAGAIAVLSTILMLVRLNPVHALLFLNVSLIAVAMVFLSLGAPFVAALEIIVYAGAIMVLFLFAVQTLNLGSETVEQERQWLRPIGWILPILLTAILLGLFLAVIPHGAAVGETAAPVGPRKVALSLFTEYVVAVELASLLLLAGLVGAYHLGRRLKARHWEKEEQP